jgi:hypothetical protein
MHAWPAVVFGWPSLIAGSILVVAGVALRKTAIAAVGALAASGFLAYLAMNPPPARIFGLFALAGNVAAALALWRRQSRVAWLSLLPLLAVWTWLVYVGATG